MSDDLDKQYLMAKKRELLRQIESIDDVLRMFPETKARQGAKPVSDKHARPERKVKESE